jgi:3'(2'), 5'-bisphosphate nucleotidase
MVAMGSSLKLCLVADGSADVYPRLGPTSEWDTCAAQAVVEEAGGRVLDAESGQPLIYNARETLLNPHFIVCARPDPDWFRKAA